MLHPPSGGRKSKSPERVTAVQSFLTVHTTGTCPFFTHPCPLYGWLFLVLCDGRVGLTYFLLSENLYHLPPHNFLFSFQESKKCEDPLSSISIFAGKAFCRSFVSPPAATTRFSFPVFHSPALLSICPFRRGGVLSLKIELCPQMKLNILFLA